MKNHKLQITHNMAVGLLVIIATVLIFANLANQYLWQDEAETALLAKNTLIFGYPKAFDGVNLINPAIVQYHNMGFGKDYAWLYHPWGQFYIAAISFKFLGINTFTARLPFAVCGVISFLLLYILVKDTVKSHDRAFLSALLITFSVPYLLLMRQCRYYAPSVLIVLFILIFYLRYLRRKSLVSIVLTSLGLIALGYTVHGMFVPVFLALMLHYLVFEARKGGLLRTFFFAGVVVSAVLPWFLSSKSLAHTNSLTLINIWKNLEFQIRMINKHVFPLFFFGGLYGVYALKKRDISVRLTVGEKDILKVILFIILTSIAAFSCAEQRQFRYLVFLMPLFAIIESFILFRLKRYNIKLLWIFLIVSISTGIFNMGKPDFFFPKYLYEITHDYDGPVEGISKFLNENAAPGDTVKIIYGDLPIMFYTGLKVDNSWIYDDDHMPEWVVFRHGWHEMLDNDYYTKIRPLYEEHVIDYPDIKWENRPDDMGYHRFSTDKEAPKVIIFERLKK